MDELHRHKTITSAGYLPDREIGKTANFVHRGKDRKITRNWNQWAKHNSDLEQ